tara:strand:- start:518 stop:1315 length:798 start_codon:yes stop_codon:yes gene_type:complete
MPTFVGKTFASYFKNILGINQTSNTGVDATTRTVHDGAGNSTSVSLSDDVLKVQPVNDNTTGTMLVNNQGGSSILKVDTTNSKVLIGAGQVAASTQYAIFGISSPDFIAILADKHYAVPFTGGGSAATNDVDFGTGTDPDDSFTTADTDTQQASQIVPMIWRLPDNITISSVTHIEGGDEAAGDTTRMHLKSFDFTSGSTSCLTNGTLLAHSDDITNAGDEQVYLETWTVDSANVDANKAILCFFRNDSVNSDYSLTVTVKYFIR